MKNSKRGDGFMQQFYDVIIIGGGVVGSSVARELSRYNVKICVLEKEADVCCGNSGRNTGLIHAGFTYNAGSLKAKFAVEGNLVFDAISKELDVPFKRTGKLTIGFTEEQRERLLALKKKGEENGVPGLSMMDRKEMNKIDPNVNGEFALYSATSGITSPYLYTIALAENAKSNGVNFFFEHEVSDVMRQSDGTFDIMTSHGNFYSKWIINSAGLNAPALAKILGSPGHVLLKVKGEYILLDKKAGEFLSLPVYPAPDEKGDFDIHVSPTIDGNVLVGPTYDEVVQTSDFDTSRIALSKLATNGLNLFEKVKPDWFIRSFAGIFPRLVDPKTNIEKDFLIEFREENPNIINLLGMNSPALTCAYPIAKHVAYIIAEREGLSKNNNFNPQRKGILRFEEQDNETRQKLIEENPDYGEIICRCECVTKAEVLEALNNPLGVSSVNSIKYRTRASMGRCQGGYCETRIAEILQNRGIDKKEIFLDNSQSYMFIGEVRESCK
jgi:glycerol-3-phosphate dehydrogenase